VKLRLLEEARTEVRDAAAYYEHRRPGIGRRFIADLRTYFRDIRLAPERFARRRARRVKAELRSVVMTRFPYEIIFYLEADQIVIAAVAHAKRRPGYWRRRLERN
jgi:plasmid stabilization system protein ParE